MFWRVLDSYISKPFRFRYLLQVWTLITITGPMSLSINNEAFQIRFTQKILHVIFILETENLAKI